MNDARNLFDGIPAAQPDELFQDLLMRPGLRVEQIVSWGQSSPEGFWYDQPQAEWVLVLEGSARLRFEDQSEPIELQRGSHVLIDAHRRHRVDWTDPAVATVWLAIHFDESCWGTP